MLVKVKDTDSKWVLFDNVEQLELDHSPVSVASFNDLLSIDPQDGTTQFYYILSGVTEKEVDDRKGMDFISLRFMRQRIPHIVVFNRLAYICNDQGRTIEKASCEDGWK